MERRLTSGATSAGVRVDCRVPLLRDRGLSRLPALDARRSDPSAFHLQVRLAQQDDAVPITSSPADGDVPMAVRAMKESAIDFLTKPVTEAALMAAVERALANSDERRSLRVRRAWAPRSSPA